MLSPIFSTLSGFALLFLGGEMLIRSASRIAAAFGLPPLLIGLTIVALGTSAPELGVSLFAALEGKPEIALSNVVGSNVFNIGFILGACGMIAPLTVNLQLIRLDIPILIIASICALGFSFDNNFSQSEGLLLVMTGIAYTAWVIYASKREASQAVEQLDTILTHALPKKSLMISVLTFLFSLGILVFGSKLLVSGASTLARLVGVSDALIGLTIVAAGTSLPEVATSVMATLRGKNDIAIGNVIGSNIYNLFLILGLSASFSKEGLTAAPYLVNFDMVFMLGAALLCFPLLLTSRKLVRGEGLILLLGYAIYLGYLIARG